MYRRICLKANAKLNLGLDVIGKRADGYHLLETVMQSVSLYDTVSVRRTKKEGITVSCEELSVAQENNIAYKAAVVFFKETGFLENTGVSIKIIKRIPSQAGMGGGSADAAATLVALNRLFKTKLSETQLCKIGEKVGADVPFCICGGTRLVRGIGEIITKLDDCADCYFVIAKGNYGVSTKQAYESVDKAEKLISLRTQKVIEAITKGNFTDLNGRLVNVFEQCTQIKDVEDIKQKLLENGAVEAAMTGSGSAVFGIFTHRKQAKECERKLKQEYPFVCTARPCISGID